MHFVIDKLFENSYHLTIPKQTDNHSNFTPISPQIGVFSSQSFHFSHILYNVAFNIEITLGNRMTDINTVLAELKRGTDEILSEADLIEN